MKKLFAARNPKGLLTSFLCKGSAVLLTALFTAASAAPILSATVPNGDWILLTDEDCNLPIQHVDPKLLLRAETMIGKQPYKACFGVDIQQGVVHLFFEDGDVGKVPIAAFSNKKLTTWTSKND